jgi:imidazolonepropionase
VFEAATARGLRVKLHAEQLSNQNGAALAAEFSALSADHLEHLDEAGVAAMAARPGRSPSCCPAPSTSLRETKLPPIDSLRAAGVPMALATDSNPGTSPLTSPAAGHEHGRDPVPDDRRRVPGRRHPRGRPRPGPAGSHGTLEAGKACDLAIWSIERPAELVYRMGFNPLFARVWRGQ